MTYASFWKRFGAYMIDGIILVIPSLILSKSLPYFGLSTGLGFVLSFLYRPFFESSSLAGTPGKALIGIAVVNESGDAITFKQACIRFFCSYLSGLLLCIGYFIQPFTAKRQTLHDMISETLVIERASSPDINYFKVWKEKFSEVVNKL
jgi:serine/threonine-protein kinase